MDYFRTLIGNPMLEAEPISQCGRTATGTDRNDRGISFRRHRGHTLLDYRCKTNAISQM